MHTSVKLDTPIEFVNLQPTEFSPLISKTEIKVCWVDDVEFNRNGTKITKEVAKGNDIYITKSASGIVVKTMNVKKV